MNDMNWDMYIQKEEISRTKHGTSYQTRGLQISHTIPRCLLENKKILDVGCESGKLLEKLKEFTKCRVQGLTLHKYDAEKDDAITYGDMHEIPFPEKTFDMVLIMNTLEHSIAPYIVLREIHRVLKDSGHIYVIMPEEGDSWTSVEGHYSVMTFRQIFNLLYKAGFSPVNNFRFEYYMKKYEGRRDTICLWEKTHNKQKITDKKSKVQIPIQQKSLENNLFKLVYVECFITDCLPVFLGRTNSLK